MKGKLRKIKKYEIRLVVLALIVIVMNFIIPKTGPLVLLDELCGAAIFILIGIWAVCRLADKGKKEETIGKVICILIAVISLAGAVWLGSKIICDLAAGPEIIRLTDLKVNHYQGHSGVFSSHYYMIGTDSQGEKFRAEISGKDYMELSGDNSVTVMYYRHTDRILKVSQDEL